MLFYMTIEGRLGVSVFYAVGLVNVDYCVCIQVPGGFTYLSRLQWSRIEFQNSQSQSGCDQWPGCKFPDITDS